MTHRRLNKISGSYGRILNLGVGFLLRRKPECWKESLGLKYSPVRLFTADYLSEYRVIYKTLGKYCSLPASGIANLQLQGSFKKIPVAVKIILVLDIVDCLSVKTRF